MNRKRFIISLAVVMIVFSPVMAQQPSQPVSVVHSEISKKIHRIVCTANGSVNVLASAGEDGILLIDTGYPQTADSLASVVDRIDGEFKYIINTHFHGDHVGGNALLADKATIIAHSNVGERMKGNYFSLPGPSAEGMPDSTFEDTLTIHFNGEDIRLIHLADGHTDGDIIVWFTKSKIAHLGDQVFADAFPFVHLATGGGVERYIANMKKISEILPDDVIMIPGHGRDYMAMDLEEYTRLIEETVTAIRSGMKDGRSVDEMIEENVLSEWEYLGGGFINSVQWTRTVYASLQIDQSPPLPSICEPVTETIVSEGIASAILRYRNLKDNAPEEYNFGENELNMLGYQLLQRSMTKEAVDIFRLNVEVYPDAFNVYDSFAEGLLANGDTVQAIFNYEKSLVLNPENQNAVTVLERIRGEE